MVTRNLFENDRAADALSWVRIGPIGRPEPVGQPCGRCDAGHALRAWNAARGREATICARAICERCGDEYREQLSIF